MCVSIIVPTYNAAAFIRETLNSVASQSWQEWELIIVNDGSTDNTLDIVKEFAAADARVRVIDSENGGESAARNLGFLHSDPNREFVIFLDHDDVWLPHALGTMVSTIRNNPDAVAVHAVVTMVDQNTRPTLPGEMEAWCRRRKKLVGDRIENCSAEDRSDLFTLAYHICVATMGICLFRRRVLPKIPFDIQLRHGGADYRLYLLVLRNGNFAFIDEVLIKKRMHQSNITNNQEAALIGHFTGFLHVYSLPDTTAANRAIMQKAYGFRIKDDMRDEFRMVLSSARRLQSRWVKQHLKDLARLYQKRNLTKLANQLRFVFVPVRSL